MKPPPAADSILIVDDSEDDVEAVVRALRRGCGYGGEIERCPDGAAALATLARCKAGERAQPGLVLLDLNMPGLDGRAVLGQIKGDEWLRAIPVVVFTTSDHELDIGESYRLGANSMIRKPIDFGSLVKIMQQVVQYWFKTVIRPEPGPVAAK